MHGKARTKSPCIVKLVDFKVNLDRINYTTSFYSIPRFSPIPVDRNLLERAQELPLKKFKEF
jgi:hypothetical protein